MSIREAFPGKVDPAVVAHRFFTTLSGGINTDFFHPLEGSR